MTRDSMLAPVKALLPRLRTGGAIPEILRGLVGGAFLQGANKFLALASSAILARILGVEGFGLFAFVVTAGGLASVGVEMGQGPLMLRESARDGARGAGESKGAHLSQSIALNLVAGTVLAGLAALALEIFQTGLSAGEKLGLAVALPLAILTALIRVLAATLVGLRRLLAGQVVEQFVAPAMLLLGALAMAFGEVKSPFLALALQIASLGAAAAWGLLVLGKNARVRSAEHPSLRVLSKNGWPFLLIGSALAINQQIDALVIGVLLGTEEVGIYRIGSQIAMAAIFPTILINTVISPFVVQLIQSSDMPRFRQLFYAAVLGNAALTGTALLLFYFFAAPAIEAIYGKHYLPAVPILLIITSGYFINCLIGPTGTVLSLTGHERLAAKILWVLAMANVALCVVVAPAFGTVGVACVTATTVAAYQLALRIAQRRLLGV